MIHDIIGIVASGHSCNFYFPKISCVLEVIFLAFFQILSRKTFLIGCLLSHFFAINCFASNKTIEYTPKTLTSPNGSVRRWNQEWFRINRKDLPIRWLQTIKHLMPSDLTTDIILKQE